MTKVTLKELKDLQTEIDASLATTKAIKEELTPWSFGLDALTKGVDHCRQKIDSLAAKKEKDDKEILEAVENLGNILVERVECNTKYKEIYIKWKKRYDDSWQKDSRLSVKMNKLKRKYWEQHGIRD